MAREKILEKLTKKAVRHLNHLMKLLLSNRGEMLKKKKKEQDNYFYFELAGPVTTILNRLEISIFTVGGQYLRRAIIIVIQNRKYLTRIEKLYSKISSIESSDGDIVTPKKVEKEITNCIKRAWESGNLDQMGYPISAKQPTNRQFIKTISGIFRD